MVEQNKYDRRRFLGSAAITIAAAQLGMIDFAKAQSGQTTASNVGSFGALKQIDAGVLNIGYAEAGAGHRVVILLHGWPNDIHSFAEVTPIDLIALMDALKMKKAILAGFDWGARTANVVAALWPERCKAQVSVSGYLIGSQKAGKIPLPPKAEFQWWLSTVIKSTNEACRKECTKLFKGGEFMFVRVGSAKELVNNQMQAFDVAGTKVSVANASGNLYAFDDTCTHRGCSLAEGELDGTTVTCPCHGSQFDITSGAVLHGPATRPVRSRHVQVEGEDLLVES